MMSHDNPLWGDPEFDGGGQRIVTLPLVRCWECRDLVPETFEHNGHDYCRECLNAFPRCEWCEAPCTPEEGAPVRVESADILPCYPHVVDGWLHTQQQPGEIGICNLEWLKQFGGE